MTPTPETAPEFLIQMPDLFFQKECAKLGIPLPPQGEYGVAMVFLPQDPDERKTCEDILEQTVIDEGQQVLGWRDVPVDPDAIGDDARAVMPRIRQLFVGKGPDIKDEAHLGRKLYVIRRVAEKAVASSGIEDVSTFYIPSLFTNRIVFKGLVMAHQIPGFYSDLADPDMVTYFAMVHSRFSTNTLGSWRLAHPYRYLIHNGEINTLRGNINWMYARQAMFSSDLFGDDMEKLFPIIEAGQSDTACIDNALELLLNTGRPLAHCMMMLVPEAWGDHIEMSQEKRDFYEYHSCMMEPWDGPALMAFTDGTSVGAILDRNGLRPFRYLVTKDDVLVMASETGVLDIPPEDVLFKARLQPGRMFYVDPSQGRIIGDEEIKGLVSRSHPYGDWLKDNAVHLDHLPEPEHVHGTDFATLLERQQLFGYTLEDLRMILQPMAETGGEPIGSMGNDAPLAVLSERPQLVFSYFKQLFAQVTNPPLDAIREELVTSTESFIGSEQNLFEETPKHAHQLKLKEPHHHQRRAGENQEHPSWRRQVGHTLNPVRRPIRRGRVGEGPGRPVQPGVRGYPGGRLHPHPLRPGSRAGPDTHSIAAGDLGCPPPPDERGQPHEGGAGGGVRGTPGGGPLLPAHRLRGGSCQPVPCLRDSGRPH